jgi:hypothetical protein
MDLTKCSRMHPSRAHLKKVGVVNADRLVGFVGCVCRLTALYPLMDI